LVYSDCGYIGRLHTGQLFSTQYEDPHRIFSVEPDKIEVKGIFFEISRPTMEPFRFVAFRLFTLSFGHLTGLGRWLKRYLVKVLIYRKRPLKIQFQRIIKFNETGVDVYDEISGPDGERVENLQWGEVFTTIHMGSSRYFIPNELGGEGPVSNSTTSYEVNPKQIASGVKLQRRINFPED
jgi:hypothetical protein